MKKAGAERSQKMAVIDEKIFGMILSRAYEMATQEAQEQNWNAGQDKPCALPCLYRGHLESPLLCSLEPAHIEVKVEYIHPPHF